MEQELPKQSKLTKIKQKVILIKDKIKGVLLNRNLFLIIGSLLGFAFGARLHETGKLAGYFNKDLKGATVLISGNCFVDGKPRVPSLSDDQVKVVYVDSKEIKGIIKKTREYVACPLNEVVSETIPPLKDILNTPATSPEIAIPVVVAKKDPLYKKFEKQTLKMTGSCIDLMTGNALPAFVDELVDVTEIAPLADNTNEFSLAGIRKNDKAQIKCLSKAIKYELFDPSSVVETEELKTDSFLGKTLIITGTCYPDPRTTAKYKANYLSLTNDLIKVTDEVIDTESKQLVRVFGKILKDQVLPNGMNLRGFDVVCDSKKFKFIHKIYDPAVDKIDGYETSESPKQIKESSTKANPVMDSQINNQVANEIVN